MIRNLKAFGLALVAMLAMGVVAASAAQAEEFTADEFPATLHGVQVAGETHLFTTAGGREVTCDIATFSGTLSAASQTSKITPTYEDCHAIVLGSELPATVTKSPSCEYEFHLPPSGGTAASVDVECSFTVDIYANKHDHEVTNQPLCQLHIAPQNGLSTVTFSNHVAAGDITANANVSGIATTRTGSASCGASGNATYVGNTVVSATNNAGEPVDGHVE